jgi:hypothetical protein
MIVNNGALTLEGQVDNEGDKNIAGIKPGAYRVRFR